MVSKSNIFMYTVHIRRNSTGETREVSIDYEFFKNGNSDLFWWTDGNFSCDCNRADVFNTGNAVVEDVPCGYTEFTVLKVVLPDGTEIEIDSSTV